MIVVAVVVVVVLVVAGAFYALELSKTTPTAQSSLPAPVCLGDQVGDWPTYLGEITRNSQNCAASDLSSATAPQLGLLWSFNTGSMDPAPLQAEPIVTNNTVYIGGGDGIFYALNATTGAKIWESPFLGTNTDCAVGQGSDGITSSATVIGGLVYVGGGDGSFYALNESNGQVNWSYFVGSSSLGYYLWSSPLVLPSLGYVYYGVASDCGAPQVAGGLDQLSLSTHQLVHFFDNLNPAQQVNCNNTAGPPFNTTTSSCGASIWGSPSYDAPTNTVWAATGNGYVVGTPEYAVSLMEWNASTLALVNHYTLPLNEQIPDGDFGTTPTLINPIGGQPMVFVTNKNGYSYAFDRANIAAGPVFEDNISAVVPESTSVSPDAYGGGLIYIGGHATNIPEPDGTHYPGSIRAFNPLVNASPIWAVGMPGEVFGAPVYSNGLVVVGGGDLLNVLNSTTGKVLYSYTASGPFFAAASIANGVIYVGNTDGDVLAFGLPPSADHAANLPGLSGGTLTVLTAGVAPALATAALIASTVRRS
ncbi:MAG: PQQ-binding-like beta-propeller repeat protein [Thermoplasmata archaeon]